MAVLDSQKAPPGEWDFTAELTDSGGLALKDVTHQLYNCTRDLRVVRVWASNSSPKLAKSYTRNYVLGSADLPATTKISVTRTPSVSLIRPYPPSLEVSAKFQTRDPVLSPTGAKLDIEQSYVFTDYSKTPSHEPGGVVTGARLYPLVKFSYRGGATELPPVRFLRFDFRNAISIDPTLTGPKGPATWVNLGGIFTDYDSLGIPPTLGNIFERGEKPLRREVIGMGMLLGGAGDWDNIHQWGTTDLPATPGAFHAAHTHWRWGSVSVSGAIGFLQGGPQFAGPAGPGKPMIDPRVPNQNLRFAITGAGGPNALPEVPAWDASANPSTANFDDLFTSARSPGLVSDGARLVQWFSIEVERDDEDIQRQPTWEGALFVHGYFFSHEDEDLSKLGTISGFLAKHVAGLKDPLLKEDATYGPNDWVRR